jgi:2-polyprenyl-3-methyl-5-hydroxy-6-metoxy-1,4-benzoquinol methylase
MVNNISKSKEIFSNKKLKYDYHGFWYLDPMPTEEELEKYYELSYWDSVNDLDYGLNLRDIRHYNILCKHFPSFNNEKKKILNFGAGHGGISIIFNLLGHEVVNIEPSNLLELFKKNWISFKNLNDIKEDKFDLVYGSHSLEHVQDIKKFNKKIDLITKDETLYLWEVPNADHPHCGPHENRVDIPHTYYFKKEYFQNFYKNIIFLEVYNSSKAKKIPPFEHERIIDKDGDSILVLAKN